MSEIINNIDCESEFSLSKYFESLEINIQKNLLRIVNDVLTYDILDTEKSKTNKLLALKEKQRQMKVGEIWQEVSISTDPSLSCFPQKGPKRAMHAHGVKV